MVVVGTATPVIGDTKFFEQKVWCDDQATQTSYGASPVHPESLLYADYVSDNLKPDASYTPEEPRFLRPWPCCRKCTIAEQPPCDHCIDKFAVVLLPDGRLHCPYTRGFVCEFGVEAEKRLQFLDFVVLHSMKEGHVVATVRPEQCSRFDRPGRLGPLTTGGITLEAASSNHRKVAAWGCPAPEDKAWAPERHRDVSLARGSGINELQLHAAVVNNGKGYHIRTYFRDFLATARKDLRRFLMHLRDCRDESNAVARNRVHDIISFKKNCSGRNEAFRYTWGTVDDDGLHQSNVFPYFRVNACNVAHIIAMLDTDPLLNLTMLAFKLMCFDIQIALVIDCQGCLAVPLMKDSQSRGLLRYVGHRKVPSEDRSLTKTVAERWRLETDQCLMW